MCFNHIIFNELGFVEELPECSLKCIFDTYSTQSLDTEGTKRICNYLKQDYFSAFQKYFPERTWVSILELPESLQLNLFLTMQTYCKSCISEKILCRISFQKTSIRIFWMSFLADDAYLRIMEKNIVLLSELATHSVAFFYFKVTTTKYHRMSLVWGS